jgi:uncharacterized membrane protein YdjX (TVP38/TMEM64 family)
LIIARGMVVRVALALCVIVALLLAGRQVASFIPQFAQYAGSHGAMGSALFVLAYAAACIVFVPASLLTLAAGAIFGFARGVGLVFIAAVIGSAAAFLIARYLARDAVAKRVERDPRFASLDRAIGTDGRRIVFLLRLSPVFPFSLLNYALGLTSVTLGDYLLASIGMLPGTALYVYYGRVAGDVAAAASGAPVNRGASYYAVLGVGLLATIVVSTIVARTARTALTRATGPATP